MADCLTNIPEKSDIVVWTQRPHDKQPSTIEIKEAMKIAGIIIPPLGL